MENGKLIYKCRRCGKEFYGDKIDNTIESVTHAFTSHGSFLSNNIHKCDDGKYGLADLIGADIDES